jgi:Fe-S cluster biogenesis protein NfuA
MSLEEGIARVELAGDTGGCGASTGSLKQIVIQAIQEAAPDLDGVEIVDAPRPSPAEPQFVQLVVRSAAR